MILTEEKDADYKKLGCDPACHDCGVPILVGDPYVMADVLSPEDAMLLLPPSSPIGSIQGMVCPKCGEKPELSPRVALEMKARLRGDIDEMIRLASRRVPEGDASPSSLPGCFLLPDGTHL